MVTRTRYPDHWIEARGHGHVRLIGKEANHRHARILETSTPHSSIKLDMAKINV